MVETQESQDSTAFDIGVGIQNNPKGSSGTEIYSGYFSEEYLQILRSKRGAKIYDEMRRSEPQINMLMSAIMNPIKSANWDFESPDETLIPDAKKMTEFIKYNATELIDWETFLHEALTFLYFGYSLFEVVHSVVINDPKFGTFNGLKALAFRGQKTIERWNLDESGKILSVDQYAYGDLSREGTMLSMDGKFLLPISLYKEGDNYEGISLLRSMYGPWTRKNLYLKLTAIGIEKYAIGTVIGTIPAGKEKSAEATAFKSILAAYTSHETAYITRPSGWEIEIQKSDFDPSKIKEIILLENTEMINSVVANFLALGTNGGGGAFALGQDLSDFFLGGIQSFANLICGVWNRRLIPSLIKMNFGPQDAYPKLKCSGIDDKAGKELAEIIKSLTDSKSLRPDDKLEEYLRKLYKLPAADKTTLREVAALSPYQPAKFAETRIQLAESYSKTFDANKQDTKDIMQSNLTSIVDSLKLQIAAKWKGASESNRVLIAQTLEPKGLAKYKADLRDILAETATEAINQAKKETPKAKSVKLSESIKLADAKSAYFENLTPALKKLVQAQANLIAETQSADVTKIVSFQFMNSATSYEDIAEVLNDIDEAVAPTIEGATAQGMSVDAAASNAVAYITNQSRAEWFFEPEVLETIESFTFTNEDPISEICKELDGTTVAANDPDFYRYSPPLHHNCKSRWVPNEKGDKNPPIDKGVAVSAKALKSMTLCECDYHVKIK
jgi:hypothetical protein